MKENHSDLAQHNKNHYHAKIMQTVNHLLNEIKIIKDHHDEIAKSTGHNFNLLSLMNMGHYEVKTHSPIIADLLNPRGSHGQEAVFLELFIELFINSKGEAKKDNEADFEFDSFSANVWMEKHIGSISTNDIDQPTGGRIDIYIEDRNNNHIFIENKIYAGDQENQLERYHMHKPKAKLIYLTLDGKDAPEIKSPPFTEEFAESFTNSIITLSYETDMIRWLENCRKEMVEVPIIRESITLYINLIKQLTNQNTNQLMSQKITEIVLQNEEKFEAYKSLVDASIAVRNEMINQTIAAIKAINWQSDFELQIKEIWSSSRKKYACLEFTKEAWGNLRVVFSFENSDCSELIFGIIDKPQLESIDRELIREKVIAKYGAMNQSGWTAWQFWSDYRNWNLETLKKIRYEKGLTEKSKFLEELKNRVISLAKICDDFKATQK